MRPSYLALLFFLFSTALFAQLPTTGIIGNWPLDGDSTDKSGLHRDASLRTSSFFTASRGNQPSCALRGGVNFPSFTWSSSNFDFALSFWVKVHTYPISYRGILFGRCPIIEIGKDSIFVGNPLLQVRMGDGWHHIVISASGTPLLYIDNVLISKTNLVDKECPLRYLGNGLDVSIDDIVMYNRGLSSSEITALYNASSSCISTSLDEVRNSEGFTLSPNPSAGMSVTVTCPETILSIQVLNVMGIVQFSTNQSSLPVLPSGLYTVRVNTKERVYDKKLVVY